MELPPILPKTFPIRCGSFGFLKKDFHYRKFENCPYEITGHQREKMIVRVISVKEAKFIM